MKLHWVAIGITLLFLSITVIWTAESYHRSQVEGQKRLALSELSTMSAALDGQLTSSLVVSKALQAEILLRPGLSPERFDSLVATIIDEKLPIRNITLARDFVVQYVYPLEDNAAVLGFDYHSDPDQLKTVQQAINNNETLLTGPVNLVQGGRALIIRTPVRTHNDELWGIIAEVLDIDKLLQNVSFYDHSDYQFSISSDPLKSSRQQLIAGSGQLAQADAVRLSMAVPGAEWHLAALPRSGEWVARSVGYLLIVIGGAMVTLMTLIFMLSLVFTHNRLRQAMKLVDHQAHFDVVTQLPNRTSFLEHLQSMVTRKPPFAVLFIDLDHFKDVNDSLGHDVGDQLLAGVAQRLRENLRGADFIARLGGDEFVIVLHNTETTEQVVTVAKNLNELLSEQFHLQQHPVQISASIGIALYPEDGGSADTLLKHADIAMYAAKTSGRKTYHFFNQQLREQTEQLKQVTERLRNALEQGLLNVHYQPIVNLTTGRIEKCEALVRWDCGQDLISPAEFIPIAEKNGLIEAIGDYVFQQVCNDWLKFKRANINLTVSVNRSEQELHNINNVKGWVKTLQQKGVPADQVVVEVNESLFIGAKTKQLDAIKYLRRQGLKIALDNFGIGVSSIHCLQTYAVDILKINRRFLDETSDEQIKTQLLQAVTGIAKALNIETIAQCVENQQQWQLMEAAGCDYGQGFYVSGALPADALIHFIKEWETRR